MLRLFPVGLVSVGGVWYAYAMRNKENVPVVTAARLVPGVHTYKGYRIHAVSGPYDVPKGRCVKVTFEYAGLMFPLVEDAYVLALAQIAQV